MYIKKLLVYVIIKATIPCENIEKLLHLRRFMETKEAFAEVIESSLAGWTSQSWQWNKFPIFGSLITVEAKKRTFFGLVYQANTGSMDPTRYPFPYQKTEAELLEEQPQIFEFLKTTFLCMTIGYKEQGKIIYLLAPEPPHIHSFVTEASKEDSKHFFSNEQFLYLLFGAANSTPINIDELLLATLKYQRNQGILTRERLNRYIQAYSVIIGNDYRRLKFFALRTQHSIQI